MCSCSCSDRPCLQLLHMYRKLKKRFDHFSEIITEVQCDYDDGLYYTIDLNPSVNPKMTHFYATNYVGYDHSNATFPPHI